MDFIMEMLAEADKNSTSLENENSDNLILQRDKFGNLCSYDKTTGKKVGNVHEHGNDKIAKSFNDLMTEQE